MSMEHWAEKLDAFLQFNEYKVLENAGSISHTIAQTLAEEEYEKFRVTQDAKFVSDFDKAVEKAYAGKRKINWKEVMAGEKSVR